ncbi:MAG TPA: hypothetical protein VE988_05410, partial [Gemmataceae bacterium]|nr:hypothetical protein [Gemmataceae bacterium]
SVAMMVNSRCLIIAKLLDTRMETAGSGSMEQNPYPKPPTFAQSVKRKTNGFGLLNIRIFLLRLASQKLYNLHQVRPPPAAVDFPSCWRANR